MQSDAATPGSKPDDVVRAGPSASVVPAQRAANDGSGERSLADMGSQLQRANAQLEFLYCVERQIAAAHDLPTLIEAVLEHTQVALGFEVVAVLLLQGGAADVYSAPRIGPARRRNVDAKEALRYTAQASTPVRRAAAEGPALERLVDPPSLRAIEVYAVPVTDGRSQVGVLQGINASLPADADATLRRLSLVAAQFGRAIVLLRERKAQERADQFALLSRCLTGLTHDMCAALQVALDCIDTLARAGDAQAGQHAARARRALSHIEASVADRVAFARGRRELVLQNVSLTTFADELRELLGPELQRHGTSLQVDLSYSGGARFDPGKLKRAVWNLARNASQAGATRLRVQIAREGEQLVVECADNGPGMARALEQRLFGSVGAQGEVEGGGFGLPMVKTIVDAHRGRIAVRSNPGNGTSFRVELPI